jgi:ParB-like chromosome segregation protein Spo0J
MRISEIINEVHWARLTAPGADEVGSTITSRGRGEPTRIIPIADLETFEPRDKTALGAADAASESNVRNLMRAIKQGRPVPPILVRRHGGAWQVVDGHHRLEAHRRLGRTRIAARILPAQRITTDPVR